MEITILYNEELGETDRLPRILQKVISKIARAFEAVAKEGEIHEGIEVVVMEFND